MKTVCFVSTRLAGTDGVSLETLKWAVVCKKLGYRVAYLAGEIGSLAQPEDALALCQSFFPALRQDGSSAPAAEVLEAQVNDAASALREKLVPALKKLQADIVIAQNIFAIPMQLELAKALVDALKTLNIACIAHNHDFCWERERFMVPKGSFQERYLSTYFPPTGMFVKHVVINTAAQRALSERLGTSSLVVPNVMDFGAEPLGQDEFNSDFREALGIPSDGILVLQPTRVVPRKSIETAIKFVHMLQKRYENRSICLVVSHHSGDEGSAYKEKLLADAKDAGVRIIFCDDLVDDVRSRNANGSKVYSLWDAYVHADFVTYPSDYEGFGNALLETVFFRLPALVNRYSVFKEDIAPCGFDFIEIEDLKLRDEHIAKAVELIDNPSMRAQVVARNAEIGEKFFGLNAIEKQLRAYGL